MATIMKHLSNNVSFFLKIDFGNQIYLSLLLAEDQRISFGAKAALMRVLRPRVKRRRVYIPSPPNTPGKLTSHTYFYRRTGR